MRSMVEGHLRQAKRCDYGRCPSTTLRVVPLPVPGRSHMSPLVIDLPSEGLGQPQQPHNQRQHGDPHRIP